MRNLREYGELNYVNIVEGELVKKAGKRGGSMLDHQTAPVHKRDNVFSLKPVKIPSLDLNSCQLSASEPLSVPEQV